MRKICVYIGSRANYSSLKSALRAIQTHCNLQLQIVLGASALLDRYGNLEPILKSDGFEITEKFYAIVEGENPTTMAKSTGLGIIEVSMILNNLKPDCVLVVGDRFDVMAPVIAASYMNIPIAHTMCGEVSGTIDESIRHAITKFAHVHFPANEDARNRVIKMGEDPCHVFCVGCPRIDLVQECLKHRNNGFSFDSETLFSKVRGVGKSFDITSEKFLLVLHHPVTTEYGENRKHIEETLMALNTFKMPTIMIWPNADAGSDEISKGIRTFRENYKPDWLSLFINIPTEKYIWLMDRAACVIGNSSSAIREGAFLGVPAVNIGTRQFGRAAGVNVRHAAYERKDIAGAIAQQLETGRYPSSLMYGDGTAGQKIADILAGLDKIPVQKKITY